MRTSAGGLPLPDWDPDQWEKRGENPDCFKCRDCGDIYWHITNPSPNTIGGKKQMRVHQKRHQ